METDWIKSRIKQKLLYGYVIVLRFKVNAQKATVYIIVFVNMYS